MLVVVVYVVYACVCWCLFDQTKFICYLTLQGMRSHYWQISFDMCLHHMPFTGRLLVLHQDLKTISQRQYLLTMPIILIGHGLVSEVCCYSGCIITRQLGVRWMMPSNTSNLVKYPLIIKVCCVCLYSQVRKREF